MADSQQSSVGIKIPKDTQTKFADLVKLILESESMNMQERQYWINILPVMTPPQIQSLQEILVNEKRQLAAIDAKYAKQVEAIGKKQATDKLNKKRGQERRQRLQTETTDDEAEKALEEDILNQIEAL